MWFRLQFGAATCALILVLALCALSETRAVLSNEDAGGVIRNLLNSSTVSGGLTCSFNVTGKSANAPSNSDTGSNLQHAAIACTGGTLYFLGGPALQHFNDSFKGANYTMTHNLPEGTISIENQELTIVNSNFKDLNPSAPSCLMLKHVNATIQSASFTGNSQAQAGAIMAVGGSNLAILNSTFSHNIGLDAGAVGLRNSSLFVNGSTFANNKGQQGGGIYFMNGTDYFFRVANSVFENNTAISGGALYAQLCSQAVYHNNRLVNNTATGSGGHIFQLNCGGAMVLNAISKGSAQAGGGAYINAVRSLSLYQNEWTGNTAKTGAGAVNFQSVEDSLVANNTFIENQGEQGGASFSAVSNCNFTSCTFTENKATLNGGAIFRTGSAGGTVSCLFENNTATKLGGAIFDVQVAGGLIDNVFKGNKAGEKSSASAYRMQSLNKITNNKGLQTKVNFENNSPNWNSKRVKPQ